MAGPNLPALPSMENMQFMDPSMFMQAQEQIGLGSQFANQQLKAGEADLQAKNLANLYSAEANPMKLSRLGLENEGMGYENTVNAVKARTTAELEQEDKTAKRQKLLASASEDDLKRLQAQAEAEMLNPDPTIQARGRSKMEGSWGEIQRRAKAADALKQTEAIVQGRKDVAETNAGSREDVARISAEAKAAKTASTTDFEALILKNAKSPTAQAEIRISRAEMLAANGDAAGAARQLQLAAEARARAAEDFSNRGLSTPGVDVPTIANLPPSQRPAANATVGTVAPPQRVVPGVTPTRGDPPPGSGIISPIEDENMRRRYREDMSNIEREYMNAKDPKVRATLAAQITKMRGEAPPAQTQVSAPAASPKAPVAPAGRVVIYKDGKAVGSVPAGQADAAVKQGYSLR